MQISQLMLPTFIFTIFFHAILSIDEAMAISLILYNIEMSFYVLKMK